MRAYPPTLVASLLAVCFAQCATGEKSNSLDDLENDVDAGSSGEGEACQGAADRTPCGTQEQTDCDAPDICVAGQCVENLVAAGTPCGDPANTSCTAPDVCDGAGTCSPNHLPSGTPCGDDDSTACTMPDTCDGAGACLQNHASVGTSCGSAAEHECSLADTCSAAGVCGSNDEVDGTTCDDCPDGAGWCTSCHTGECQNLCQLAAPVETTFAGGNGLNGNMFDVETASDVRITGFDINVPVQPDGAPPHNVLVYYREGTYVGSEQTAGAWTLLGGTSVISAGDGAPTPVPLALDLFVPAGDTVSFYVTTSGTSMRYTNGTNVGDVAASDGVVTLYEGSGNADSFGNFFAPRVFNGNLHYDLCQP